MPGLTQLAIDLRGTPISNLQPISKLRNLKELSLDLRASKVSDHSTIMGELNYFFMMRLGLHLRSAIDVRPNEVENLAPLSELSNLVTITLYLDESPVSSLEPLTKLQNLLKLSIKDATSTQRMSLQKLPPSVVELSF